VQYWIITLIDAFRILFSEIPMIKCVTLTKAKRKCGLDVNLVFDGVGYEKHAATHFEVGRTTKNHGRYASPYLMCGGRVLAPLQNHL